MPRFELTAEPSDGSESESDNGSEEEEEPSHPLGFGDAATAGTSPWGKTWISLDPPSRSEYYYRSKPGRSTYDLDDEEDLFVQSYPPLSSYLSSTCVSTAALLRFGTKAGRLSSDPYPNGQGRDNDDDLYYSSADDDDDNCNNAEHGSNNYRDDNHYDDSSDDENTEIALLFQSPPQQRLSNRPASSSAVSLEDVRRTRFETDRRIQRRVAAQRAKIDEECHKTMTILGDLVLQTKREAKSILRQKQAAEQQLAREQSAREERERKIREEAERDAALRKAQADKVVAEQQQAAQRQREVETAKSAAIEKKRQEAEARAKKKTEHIDKAKKLVGQLVQVRASVEPFEKNKAIGKRRLGMKKIAKGKVNTLNDSPAKIQDVATEISQAITRYDQEDAQIKQQLQQKAPGVTPDMAVGRRYFIDLLSATAMTRVQAESFSGTKGDGFPLAAMLAMVSTENKNIQLVLAAHVYTVCPTAIPTLPKPAADASEDDVMTGLGMQRTKKTGDFESFPQFLARTENLVSFMASIQSSLPSSHQLMGGNTGALLWLKRFLDLLPPPPTSPLPLTTAPVLGAFLTCAGHMLANIHESNFQKLLSKIEEDIVHRLDEGAIGKPSAIRLTKVLEGGFEAFKKKLPAKAIKDLYYGASEHSQKNEAVTSFSGTIGGEEDIQPKRDPASAPSRQQQHPSNPFGGGPTSGFGGGAPAPSPFGGTAAPSPSPSPSPFGGTAAPSTSPFGGPAAPSPSPFGGPAAPSPSAFGGPAAPSPSPFGGGAAPSPSPFGGSATPSPSPFGGPAAPSPSPFGGGAAPSPSPFGGPTASSPSPFGGGAAPSPSPFGGPAPSPSPFGGPAAPSPSPFGGPHQSPFGRGNATEQNSPFGGNGQKKGFRNQNAVFGSNNNGGTAAFGSSNNNNGGKKKPCRFFAQGRCKKGDKCAYSHDLGAGFGGGNNNNTGFQSNNWNNFGGSRR